MLDVCHPPVSLDTDYVLNVQWVSQVMILKQNTCILLVEET